MSYTAPPVPALLRLNSIDTFDAYITVVASTASAWPSANLAIYCPIAVPHRVVVTGLWLSSGSTGTGNLDIGIFDAAGARIVSSGAVAKIAAASEQIIDIADTTLSPGRYYIGLSASNATDTYYRGSVAAPNMAAFGVYTEASAHPLPTTATFGVDQTNAILPIVGLLTNATVT